MTAVGDRPASVSGRFRFEALGNVDYPTVGDWVVVDRDGVISAVLPRRTSFKRLATDRSSRKQAELDDEQVMASNVDVALLVAGLDHDFNLRRIERYLSVAWSSGVTPVVVLNKSDLADDVDERLVAVEAHRAGRRDRRVSAWTGAGLDELRTAPRLGHDRGDPGLVGRRQVHAGQRPAGRGAPGDRRRPGGRIRGVATRRPTASCSSCPVARCWSTRPGIRALEILGADEGLETAFDDVIELAAACRFSDCRARRRAGLRRSGRAGRRPPERGSSGQPPQARA